MLVPARVIIEMPRPVPCPNDASKFAVSMRTSSIMSEFGDDARRRSLPLLVAPSIVHSFPPTPPGADVSLDVRLTNPCATYGTAADELTPVTNRVRSTGMFENIGRLSTLRRSRFCPVVRTPVSRIGASPLTVTVSLTAPTPSVRSTVACWATDRMMPLRTDVLKPCSSAVTR